MTSAIILAAGRGERLRPLTDHTPKALIEVAGEPIIVRHLHALSRAGIRDIVINLSHLGNQIQEALGDGSQFDVRIQYSQEPDPPLETGGGIVQALPLLGPEPFWVVNADICTDYVFAPPALGVEDLGHLVLVDNPDHNPDGDFCLQHGRICTQSDLRLTFSGIGFYRPQFFADCQPGRFSLTPLLREAIAQKKMSGQHYEGLWLDIGTAKRYAYAQSLF